MYWMNVLEEGVNYVCPSNKISPFRVGNQINRLSKIELNFVLSDAESKLQPIEKRLEAKVQPGKKVSFDNDGGHFFVHHSLDEKQCAQLEKDCLEKDKSDRLEHQSSDDDNPDNDSNGDEEMLNINDPGYFVSRAQDYSFSPVKAPDQVLLLTYL